MTRPGRMPVCKESLMIVVITSLWVLPGEPAWYAKVGHASTLCADFSIAVVCSECECFGEQCCEYDCGDDCEMRKRALECVLEDSFENCQDLRQTEMRSCESDSCRGKLHNSSVQTIYSSCTYVCDTDGMLCRCDESDGRTFCYECACNDPEACNIKRNIVQCLRTGDSRSSFCGPLLEGHACTPQDSDSSCSHSEGTCSSATHRLQNQQLCLIWQPHFPSFLDEERPQTPTEEEGEGDNDEYNEEDYPPTEYEDYYETVTTEEGEGEGEEEESPGLKQTDNSSIITVVVPVLVCVTIVILVIIITVILTIYWQFKLKVIRER